MFRFEHIEFLWFLAAIPLLWSLFALYRYWRKKTYNTLGDPDLIQRLSLGRSKARENLKLTLLSLAFLLIIIALANPQWGLRREKVQAKGSDIVIAMDISKSMLCEDLAPNRLERSKKFVERLIDKLKGERIGIIFFAGNAYLQMPLTTDYAAAKLFAKSASTNLASSQGTAIGDAIDLARQVFGNEDKFHKALIIITDGENHDTEAATMAKEAGENGMILFLVGVGTPEGGFIPNRVGGRQDYLRDKSGEFVKTAMNEELMRQLAQDGQGAYYNIISRDKILVDLDRKIDQLEKRELEQRSFEEFESYYQYFLFLGMIFLLMELFIHYRNNEKWKWEKN